MRYCELQFCGAAKRCLVVSGLALSVLAGFAMYALAQGMALPGKFGVSAVGAATYTIPLPVPPGTAGMVPSLSLSYSSQTGNGLLGVGWSLDGLVSVGRCPRTIAQDGVYGSVSYDANDRFCLDGQRLIAISGTYGADGTEYRTEIESFSKIISHGVAGTGPAWFEARTKAGQVLQFGNTTDSRVLAQGKPTARDWMVNKVSDTKGNYFAVTYVNDTTNGQAYPTRIDYTANDAAGLAAYNSVRFVYDTARPDVVPFYRVGSLLKTTVRLTNLQTYAGANLVADYRLAYQQGTSSGRSQLASVTLCDGASTCLPATTFGWQNGGGAVTVTSNVAGQNGTLVGSRPYVGDFNGDGQPDVLWDASTSTSSPTSSGTRVLWTNAGSGGFTVNNNAAGQNGTLSNYAPIIADFNRDGRTDVWWYQIGSPTATTKWTAAVAGGFAVAAGPVRPAGQVVAMVADLNSDSRPDAAWRNIAFIGQQQFFALQLNVSLTNADGTITTVPSTVDGSCRNYIGTVDDLGRYRLDAFSGVDFDGDGKDDLFWQKGPDYIERCVGDGDGTFSPGSAGFEPTINGFIPYFVDVNGDGATDIIWDKLDSSGRSAGQRILWLSKGDATFIKQSNVSGQDGTLIGYVPVVADFNGDGIADILWDQVDTNGLSSGAHVLWAGKGDGTFTVTSNYGGLDGTLIGYVPVVADFNGDGKADILWDNRSGTDTRSQGQRVLWLSDGVRPDVMTSVTTGLGASLAITYRPLTDASIYSKDGTAVDPMVDVQGGMLVVSRVDASNGIGGTVSTTYTYAGAKGDHNGRGFLGFRQMTVTDLQTNIVETTTYRQDFPFTGLVASQSRVLGAQTLSQASNTYEFKNTSGGTTLSTPSLTSAPYRASLSQAVVARNDLNGAALPTVTSTYQYDAYGNATEVSVSAADGFSKTTTNTYSNDTTNWLLGRLTNATVTSTKP
jgi:hypothetical protein